MTSRGWLALLVLLVAVRSAEGQDQKLTKPSAKLAHQFSSIAGVRELADGRVLVSDGIDQVLVRADLATQRMDTIGRAGQGPGEYKSPDQLLPLPQGATLLTDLGNARLTVYDGAGKYRESIPIAQGGAGGAAPGALRLVLPRGTDALGRIYYQPAGADPKADSAAVIRWDRTSGKQDTVARVKLATLVTKSAGTQNSRSIRQRPPPYPLQETWIAAPDGRIALIRVPTYRVDWVLPTGARVAGKPIPSGVVPVREAEKKEYLEEQATNGLAVQVQNVNGQISMTMSRGRAEGDREQDAIESTEWPAAKPPTTGTLLAGADGTIWVERSAPANTPRSYDVIGAAGEVVRRVVLPAGRRAVAIGARGLYARYVDDSGVAYLERYDAK